jgi:hypothetical protein
MSVNQSTVTQRDTVDAFQADATGCGAYLRCKFNTNGVLTVAGATDDANMISVSAVAANAIGFFSYIAGPGTRWGIASGAISAGSPIYSAAAGQISATQGTGHLIGRAVTDGTNGNPFIWIPLSENSSAS